MQQAGKAVRLVAAVAVFTAWAGSAMAYTAAGDRSFPATVLVPQLSPTDEFYLTTTTQPNAGTRTTNLTGVYDKMLTERLGIALTGGYSWVDPTGASSTNGWQNLAVNLQYLAILDPSREFVLSFGVEREFGGTGQAKGGANPHGVTVPALFLGKGLGDYDLGYLRPLAITAMLGYQRADGNPRPDQLVTGFVIEYSLPYLESKVQSLGLPVWLAGMTPMVEMQFQTPVGSHAGSSSTGIIAPGFNFSGEGWDLGVEALLPTNRASGGTGVAVQLHLSLDYLFPDTLGKPLLSRR